jgi:hypothetical protein
MKVIIHHDSKGKIISIGIPAPDQGNVGISPGPGQAVRLIDFPAIQDIIDLEKGLKGFRLDVKSGKLKAMKRTR